MRFQLLSFLVLVGCGRIPTAPTLLSEDREFQPVVVEQPEGIADDPAVPFALAPGDVVTLRTMSATNIEYTGLIIDERGHLHVPLAGDVPVGGRTLADAEAAIEETMRAFDRVIRVSVILQTPGGHVATVLGAVTTPGRVVITPGMRLADLVAAVGGPRMDITPLSAGEAADLPGARLMRGGEALPVSVELAMRGDRLHNVRVRPGDHLYVPWGRGATLTMLGELEDPGVIGFRPGIRLTTALALAGGLGPDAHRRDIRVIRGSFSSPRVFRTSLRALVDGEGPDVELAPGDIVFVTRTGVANIRDVMNTLTPALFTAQNVGLAVGLSRSSR